MSAKLWSVKTVTGNHIHEVKFYSFEVAKNEFLTDISMGYKAILIKKGGNNG